MNFFVCSDEKYVSNVLPAVFTGVTDTNVTYEYLDFTIIADTILYNTFFLKHLFTCPDHDFRILETRFFIVLTMSYLRVFLPY